MNLKARRIGGSSFSQEDKLEVVFNSDNQMLSSVVHTVELVSGVGVTHGGGAKAGDYLHYKAVERDADGDGIIDYSNVIMNLIQEEQGTSVIKVKCAFTYEEEAEAFNDAMLSWVNEPESETKGPKPLAPNPTILSTGEITLDWTEDGFK